MFRICSTARKNTHELCDTLMNTSQIVDFIVAMNDVLKSVRISIKFLEMFFHFRTGPNH